MRAKIRLIVALIACTISADARAQADALQSRMLNLWWDGRYAEVVFAGKEYRARYGRDLNVDYMIGTSACRVREYRERGQRFLDLLIREYGSQLHRRQRDMIALESGKCAPPWGPSVIAYYRTNPAVAHMIGAAGAAWDPTGHSEDIDAEGEDLPAILNRAYFQQGSTDAILQEDLPSPDQVEVAPCGDFCGAASPRTRTLPASPL